MNWGALISGGLNGALLGAMLNQQQPGQQNAPATPQFQMPGQGGGPFSMPPQASAQYGMSGPGYQNMLARALMAYGGGGGF